MANARATLGGFEVEGTSGGVTFTRTLGIQPDSNTVPVAWTAEAIPTTPVDLMMTDGTTTITIYNLYIDSYTARRNAGGNYIDFVVRDRRRQWAFGYVVGELNKPGADGTPTQDYTARDLAGLLLDQMGETDYVTAGLPADVYPYVRWEWANPAQELQRLCDAYGAAVALLLDDTVAIVELGSGAAFPSGSFESDAPGQKLTGRPGKYIVVGGRLVIERTETLEPVGLEATALLIDDPGTVKALADLSYAPIPAAENAGFGTAGYRAIDDFMALDAFTGTYDCPQRQAASESIWRWYRLPADVLGLLPILDEIVQTKTENGLTVRMKPYVVAAAPIAYLSGLETGPDGPAGLIDASEYEIDADLGVVKFKEPMFTHTRGYPDVELPASLKLTFAYESIGVDGIEPADYYAYEEGTGIEQILYHPELVLYGMRAANGIITWQNQTAVDTEAAAIVASADPGADYVSSRAARWAGITTCDLDGKMRSIAYHVGADGAVTDGQYNMEFPRAGAATSAEKSRRVVTAANSRILQGQEMSARGVAPAPGGATRGVPRSVGTPDWGMMKNVSGRTCPRGGLVMPVGYDQNVKAEKFCPALPGMLSIRIAAAEIAPGALGPVFTSGKHWVYAPGCAAVYAGDRFTGNGDFYPAGYYGGLFFGVMSVHSVAYFGTVDAYGRPLADWLIAEALGDNGWPLTFVGGEIDTGFYPMAVDAMIFGTEFKAGMWQPSRLAIKKV